MTLNVSKFYSLLKASSAYASRAMISLLQLRFPRIYSRLSSARQSGIQSAHDLSNKLLCIHCRISYWTALQTRVRASREGRIHSANKQQCRRREHKALKTTQEPCRYIPVFREVNNLPHRKTGTNVTRSAAFDTPS